MGHTRFSEALRFPLPVLMAFEQVLFAGVPGAVRSPGERCGAGARNKNLGSTFAFPPSLFAAPGF